MTDDDKPMDNRSYRKHNQ